jgi:hypothetical protein
LDKRLEALRPFEFFAAAKFSSSDWLEPSSSKEGAKRLLGDLKEEGNSWVERPSFLTIVLFGRGTSFPCFITYVPLTKLLKGLLLSMEGLELWDEFAAPLPSIL